MERALDRVCVVVGSGWVRWTGVGCRWGKGMMVGGDWYGYVRVLFGWFV